MADSTKAPFEVEVAGKTYSCWVADTRPDGKPDADDEFFLEIRTGDDDLSPLLFITHASSTGALTLTAQAPDLPVELVEWSVARARARFGHLSPPA